MDEVDDLDAALVGLMDCDLLRARDLDLDLYAMILSSRDTVF